jgi:hypothetical protein
MPRAKYISPSGQEIFVRVIRSNRDSKVWAECDGSWMEFSDPLYDPRDGSLAFVEIDPPDPTLRPCDRRTIRHLRELELRK